jgi:hypothetical protein
VTFLALFAVALPLGKLEINVPGDVDGNGSGAPPPK